MKTAKVLKFKKKKSENINIKNIEKNTHTTCKIIDYSLKFNMADIEFFLNS